MSFTPYPNAQLAQREQPLAGAAYQQLYSFKSGADGANPISGLTEINGAYYGTTYGGGASLGWGTVFKITADGAEHVIYKFKAGNDGAHPYAGLTGVNGTLYGTTYQGGTSGNGTVFKISTSGAERVLYSFKGGDDGSTPMAASLPTAASSTAPRIPAAAATAGESSFASASRAPKQ